MFRQAFYAVSAVLLLGIGLGSLAWPPLLWSLVLVGPLVLLGLRDALQRRRAVLRNWPLIGRFRYMFEAIRPEIQQYFVESNTDGTPFNREQRAVVYQRGKRELDTLPFGTQLDVYEPGYEWMSHSMRPLPAADPAPRVCIGAEQCARPYDSSYLNVSAMSFGSLGRTAIEALNRGARAGGFAHNTGEGGLSRYHLEPGGDLIWQIGTGYFGCRDAHGRFELARYAENAQRPSVRMIELKLSQGAKPGHGGILPARKLTAEIAQIRGVPMGRDVLSPPGHSAFDSPAGLLDFLARLREHSGGKPVGIKLCVGEPVEFLGLLKAMRASGLVPDFISVDGGEGGTGAAPVEFSNAVGWPLREGLVFVHSALVGAGLRARVRLIASGKIITGFHMVRALAMGADVCASARGMMFALGCIQARRCNNNTCPTGVATQDPALTAGLDVSDKSQRVEHFQRETVASFLTLVGAAGLRSPTELTPGHLYRRVDEVRALSYSQIYDFLGPGELLSDGAREPYASWWAQASAETFSRQVARA